MVGCRIGLAQAEEQRQAADDRRQQAEAAKVRAQTLAAAEAQARRNVEAQRERTEWALYGSRLSLAMYAWKDNEPRITRELLADCPAPFRHWEYAYLRRLAASNQCSWKTGLEESPIESVAVAPDGRRVVVAQPLGHLQVVAADTGKPLLLLRTGRRGTCRVCSASDSQRFASVQQNDPEPDGQSASGMPPMAASF